MAYFYPHHVPSYPFEKELLEPQYAQKSRKITPKPTDPPKFMKNIKDPYIPLIYRETNSSSGPTELPGQINGLLQPNRRNQNRRGQVGIPSNYPEEGEVEIEIEIEVDGGQNEDNQGLGSSAEMEVDSEEEEEEEIERGAGSGTDGEGDVEIEDDELVDDEDESETAPVI